MLPSVCLTSRPRKTPLCVRLSKTCRHDADCVAGVVVCREFCVSHVWVQRYLARMSNYSRADIHGLAEKYVFASMETLANIQVQN